MIGIVDDPNLPSRVSSRYPAAAAMTSADTTVPVMTPSSLIIPSGSRSASTRDRVARLSFVLIASKSNQGFSNVSTVPLHGAVFGKAVRVPMGAGGPTALMRMRRLGDPANPLNLNGSTESSTRLIATSLRRFGAALDGGAAQYAGVTVGLH